MNQNHPYFGLSAVLATKHGKGKDIAPPFLNYLGMRVEEVNVDTDSLGTFSGEIERIGHPQDVVIAKARLGVQESGCPRAIASEGSIGADPFIPFINSDIEFIALVDEERGIQVVETFRSTDIIAQSIRLTESKNLEHFLEKADFPRHKLIVRSDDKQTSFCLKGIDDSDALHQALTDGFHQFPSLIVESDLRAHCSPTRQANIALAAKKLAMRLSYQCPECATPGWGVIGYNKGLPCLDCGEISLVALESEILGCSACSYRESGKTLAKSIDPSRCDLCNP